VAEFTMGNGFRMVSVSVPGVDAAELTASIVTVFGVGRLAGAV